MGKAESKYVNAHTKNEVIDLFRRHVSSGKVQFFRLAGFDFAPGVREGPSLRDLAGKKHLLNCHCNGGVFNLGHRNPEIIETLRHSLHELDIGNHHLISEQRAVLAEKLAQLTPGDLTCTVFGVGGGEAVDLAIKIARGYTGKTKVISAKGAYHGHTGLALAAGAKKFYAPFGPQAPGFVRVPFNNLAAIKQALDDDTAAILFETVPATYGMPIPDPAFFPQVREICDESGTLLIIDEVQTGLGRTGKLWGIEHFEVVPDIMVIGKGLSGGIYPITATCFKKPYEAVFQQDPFIHISTFGGAEVGCPVALKVLEMSSEPAFLAHVLELANIFREGFDSLQDKYPELFVGLRQLGLMMGIETRSERFGPLFAKAAYDCGLFMVYAGNNPAVVQFLPPLILDDGLAHEILERVDKAFNAMKKMI
ncbi:MAG: aspartate aminotransferase family protein [bacterium]